jgi:hypothetical protein
MHKQYSGIDHKWDSINDHSNAGTRQKFILGLQGDSRLTSSQFSAISHKMKKPFPR